MIFEKTAGDAGYDDGGRETVADVVLHNYNGPHSHLFAACDIFAEVREKNVASFAFFHILGYGVRCNKVRAE